MAKRRFEQFSRLYLSNTDLVKNHTGYEKRPFESFYIKVSYFYGMILESSQAAYIQKKAYFSQNSNACRLTNKSVYSIY